MSTLVSGAARQVTACWLWVVRAGSACVCACGCVRTRVSGRARACLDMPPSLCLGASLCFVTGRRLVVCLAVRACVRVDCPRVRVSVSMHVSVRVPQQRRACIVITGAPPPACIHALGVACVLPFVHACAAPCVRYRESPFDTSIFVLQTAAGAAQWPATREVEMAVRRAFAEGVPTPAMVARRLKKGRGVADADGGGGVYKGRSSAATGGVRQRRKAERRQRS